MSTLSTHVLDTALGCPAQGIRVTLERAGALLGSGVTDVDGRIRDWRADDPASHPTRPPFETGSYRLAFHVAEYFAATARESFYEIITIDFRIARESEHYHVPLLLNPFGYSTYRGS